jgi:hypothetical protein
MTYMMTMTITTVCLTWTLVLAALDANRRGLRLDCLICLKGTEGPDGGPAGTPKHSVAKTVTQEPSVADDGSGSKESSVTESSNEESPVSTRGNKESSVPQITTKEASVPQNATQESAVVEIS